MNRHSGFACDHCGSSGVFSVKNQVIHWVVVLLSVAVVAGLCELAWKAVVRK
jgi:hypothetical protein